MYEHLKACVDAHCELDSAIKARHLEASRKYQLNLAMKHDEHSHGPLINTQRESSTSND